MKLRFSKKIMLPAAVFFFVVCIPAGQPARAGEKAEVFVQLGHGDAVRSVAFSPDGRYALSGSWDQTLKLWDAATGREIRTFAATGGADSVAFSPDGRYALSGNRDHTLKLWDVATGREIRTFAGHADFVDSVAFSPDGRYALSGSWDRTLKLWDVATGREIRTFTGHRREVTAVAFSPDGRYALSGSRDQTLKLWDVATGREIRTFTGHTFYVNSVAFSPDGKYALSGGALTLRLWDVATGRELKTFTGHNHWVLAVAFSPDGRFAVSGSEDHTLKIWDVAAGRVLRTIGEHSAVTSVAFSPDGRQVLSGDDDHMLKLWDAATGRELRTFTGHSSAVTSVVFSPDGRRVRSGSQDHTVRLWDITAGEEIKTFTDQNRTDRSVVFSPDGRYSLSWSDDFTLELSDGATGNVIRRFTGHKDIVTSAAFSPDGRYALSGSNDHTLKLWNVATGRELRTFTGHGSFVSSVAFSPDGRYALSGSGDHTVRLWEVSTGREIRTFTGHSEVWSVAFSPDGRFALSGSGDGTTRLWDVATGKEIARFVGFADGEWVAVTPEGYFNASPNGAKYLNVRAGNRVGGIDQFYAKFYRPELVRLALAGKEVPKGETFGDILARSPAPTVEVVSPVPGSSVDKDSITVSVKITDNGGGIGAVNIYLNGSQVANETRGITVKGKGPAEEKILSFTVPLLEGRNEIRAVAFNRENSMESAPAGISVISRAVLRKPDLHALVIGINEYRNRSISLAYAASDAAAFAETLKKAAAPLFGKTDIRVLTAPAATTKEAITSAFEKLRDKVKPNDLFVFYDASHGVVDVVNDEEQYFLLTSNVLFLSSRHIGEDAMSQTELAKLIGSIPAQKKLVILDTCNAGRGGREIQIALLQQTRGLTDSTAVKLLQRAIGSAVFSASSDTQQALEGYKGHGLFTYVLMEGLRGKADFKKDGYITVLGLADYVEEEVGKLSEQVFNRQQTPTIETGANFPVGRVQ